MISLFFFLDYKKLLNCKQLNRTKANSRSCFPWDNNNSLLDNGIKSRSSIKGLKLSNFSLLGSGKELYIGVLIAILL